MVVLLKKISIPLAVILTSKDEYYMRPFLKEIWKETFCLYLSAGLSSVILLL